MKEGFLYFYWRVGILSRNANNGAKARFTYWNLNNSSGNDNVNISSQFSLYNFKNIKTLPLGKI